jgi:hypothetical protein
MFLGFHCNYLVIFWVYILCSVLGLFRNFGEICCFCLQDDSLIQLDTEASEQTKYTAWRKNLKNDCHLCTLSLESALN